MLPPGQQARKDFPRFGLPPFAENFPRNIDNLILTISVYDGTPSDLDLRLLALPRSDIQSDFHCVASWSYLGAHWSGVKFFDFYEKCILPLVDSCTPIVGAVLYGQDGYRTTLILKDLLDNSVLLADSLDGQPLTIEHGAPIRLVAPKHYGYKNIKHLKRIEFHSKMPVIKGGFDALADHPRARVSKEERGRWVPGWILRYAYRLLIASTVKKFRDAMNDHHN